MDNKELLEALEKRFDAIDQKFEAIAKQMDKIDSRLECLEETTEVTRESVNSLLSWAEHVSNAISFPLPKV